MIKGSCLCGSVAFEISGTPRSLSHCHCSRCRKAGGIYSAVLIGDEKDLKVVKGQGSLSKYTVEAPWKFHRSFCKKCGSPLGELSTEDGLYVVAASALDTDPGLRPMAHLHMDSKAPWYDVTDDVEQFSGDYIPPK